MAELATALTAWVPLAGAVVGAGAALIGAFLNNRGNTQRLKLQLEHEAQRKQSEKLRERGQDLYFCADRWLKRSFSAYLRFGLYIQGKLKFEDIWGTLETDDEDVQGEFARIALFIELDFPELIDAWAHVMNTRKRLSDLEIDFLHGRALGAQEEVLKQQKGLQQQVEQAGGNFKRRLVEEIRRIS